MNTIGRPVRHRCDLHAQLAFPNEPGLSVRVLDLSEQGAFLATNDDLQYDANGRLTLELPGGGPFEVNVRVVRLGVSLEEVRDSRVDHITVSRRGAAVRFESFPESEVDRLREFLEELDER